MEGSDIDQRDLVPVGRRLRRYILKYYDLGVRSLEDDLVGEDPMELDVEWKRYSQLYALSAASTFSTLGLSFIPKGFQSTQRTGRRIRVVGLEMSFQVQLLARTAGEQTSIPATANFTTAVRENGPAYFRILLLVSRVNDPDASSYPNVFDHSGYPCSQFADDTYSLYRCIFDKKYVLPAAGGKILDHVYIDCDFVQDFGPENLDATLNFVECRYFLDEGEALSLPNGRMQFSTYFEDD